jgi:hypothetical protein
MKSPEKKKFFKKFKYDIIAPKKRFKEKFMKKNTIKEIIRYKFDNFMSKGGSSIFFSLLVIFVGLQLCIGFLRGVTYFLFPEAISQNARDFMTNFFITFLQLTDPGNMAQDITSSYLFKISAIIAGLAGVIMFSALIAFITNALDRKISALKKGFSKVIESNHTVILGWDKQRILEIIRELIIANESEKSPCILILSETDKEQMDDFLSVNLGDTKNTRIVTRSGNISSLARIMILWSSSIFVSEGGLRMIFPLRSHRPSGMPSLKR